MILGDLQMEKVSIIVPVYNSEKYIETTIRSILNQTYKNIEIIIINDGSKDNSSKICKRLAEANSNILFIDKTNEGVSKTRNLGIEVSSGEFIQFVDADDTIENSMTELMVNSAKRDDCDWVITNYNTYSKDKLLNPPSFNSEILDRKKFLSRYYVLKEKKIANAIWNKLYVKRKIVENKIKFKEDLNIAEDVHFNNQYLLFIRRVSLINSPLYNYITVNNDLSLTKKYNPKINESIKFQYNHSVATFNKINCLTTQNHKMLYEEYIFGVRWAISNLLMCGDDTLKFEKYLDIVKALCQEDFAKSVIFKNKKVWIWMSLINLKLYKLAYYLDKVKIKKNI